MALELHAWFVVKHVARQPKTVYRLLFWRKPPGIAASVPARTEEALASLAANIRKLRRSRDLTQEQLAEHTGLHLTYIQGIERGTRNISVGVLLTVAEALKVPPYRLFRPAKLEPPKRGRPRKTKRKAPEP